MFKSFLEHEAVITRLTSNFLEPNNHFCEMLKALEFDKKNHDYWVAGKLYQSATSLNRYNQLLFASIEKKVIDCAQRRGINFHSFIEKKMIEDVNDYDYAHNDILKTKLKRFVPEFEKLTENWVLLFCEQKLVSSSLPIAGTLDAFFYDRENDQLLLVDWKGGSQKEDSLQQKLIYDQQMNLYELLLRENFYFKKSIPLKKLVVFLGKDKMQKYEVC